MRTALAITATVVAMLLIQMTWSKPVAYLGTRIPPETHPDSKPRFRRWENGVEIFG